MNKFVEKAVIALALVGGTALYANNNQVFAQTYTRTYIDSDGSEVTETSSEPFDDSDDETEDEAPTAPKQGWSTNDDGNKVYYLSNGKLAKGYHTINGTKYHFEKDGSLTTLWVNRKYIFGRDGKMYRYSRSKRGNHTVAARRIAKLIAKVVGHKAGDTDRKRAGIAADYVSCFAGLDRYSMKHPYYNKAYGVFINGYCSCAGTTDATRMVLHYMGMNGKHVNRNKFSHQWVSVRLDGKKGWVDGQVGAAGYGAWGTHSYNPDWQ